MSENENDFNSVKNSKNLCCQVWRNKMICSLVFNMLFYFPIKALKAGKKNDQLYVAMLS